MNGIVFLKFFHSLLFCSSFSIIVITTYLWFLWLFLYFMAIIIIVIIWFEFIYIYIWIIDITVKYHRHHITFIINTFLSGTCYIQLLIVITILKLDCINSFLKIRTLTCFGKASRYLHDFRLSQIDIFHVSCEGFLAMIFLWQLQIWPLRLVFIFGKHDVSPENLTNHQRFGFHFWKTWCFLAPFLNRRRGGCPLCPFTWTLAGRSHGCSVAVDWGLGEL